MKLDPKIALRCMQLQLELAEVLQAPPEQNRVKMRWYRKDFDPEPRQRELNRKVDSIMKRHRLRGSDAALRGAIIQSYRHFLYWTLTYERVNRDGLGRTQKDVESLISDVQVILKILCNAELAPTTIAELRAPCRYSPEVVGDVVGKFLSALRFEQTQPRRKGALALKAREFERLAAKLERMKDKLGNRQVLNRILLGSAIACNEPLSRVGRVDDELCAELCVDPKWLMLLLSDFLTVLQASEKINGSKTRVSQYAYKEAVTAPLAAFWRGATGRVPKAYRGECPFINFVVECCCVAGIPTSRAAWANLNMDHVFEISQTRVPIYWQPPT